LAKFIDLFAGAGGFSLGFRSAFKERFIPVWANDDNKAAVATYNVNFGNHCIEGDIVDLLKDKKTKIPAADVVIGGPPCQGFSLLNKQRSDDARKQLWRPYLEIVERSGADVFVMENVPQLLGSEEHQQIIEAAEALGFTLISVKLLAADYGVPQLRTRAFILACRFTDPANYFPSPKTHYNPNNGNGNGHGAGRKPWRTVRDAMGDLPKPISTELRAEPVPLDLHFTRTPTPKSLLRYRAIPEEGMNRFDLQRLAPELTPICWIKKTKGGTDLFGRMWWNRPAFTIRTEFFKPEKGRYLHPVQDRSITHREAARLQSFPDDFYFCGSKIEVAKQIGNAVPPMLAQSVAECVKRLLKARPKRRG
jgi:DNA (cytosine-5)-methyltransferase 1